VAALTNVTALWRDFLQSRRMRTTWRYGSFPFLELIKHGTIVYKRVIPYSSVIYHSNSA
jgi:hypothetical protein